MAITLTINGTDASALFNKYDYVEIPRKVRGTAVGESIGGSFIDDVRALKYDLMLTARPLEGAGIAQLAAFAAAPSVTISYFSPSANAYRTSTYVIDLTEIKKEAEWPNRVLWNGLVLNCREK